MGTLSWTEVRDRAIRFSRDWADAESERAEKQTFWNEFFNVFGITRRSVASFEAPVRKLSGSWGAIDLFWRGRLLVEHKSRGEDLDSAASQAFNYVEALASEGRHDEQPRHILLSDFEHIALFDLEGDISQPLRFPLTELHRHVRAFAFMLGQEAVRVDPEDPANAKAFDLMCGLHDALEDGGFNREQLERYLVRVLFCLFAEDTGLFPPNAFSTFLQEQTREDGSDLGARLNELFYVLDTPAARRAANLHPDLAALPHVNGQLFGGRLDYASFTSSMREKMIECAHFFWARISPAVFGSLFQGVLDDDERRQQGAHYTSERDIMKILHSLTFDDLRSEFAALKSDRSTRRMSNLQAFHQRLRTLRFLDPACGCGNFLVLAYRELRVLEFDVLMELTAGGQQQLTDVRHALLVDVDQLYGIEKDEWPARIAEVALWLMDHQMNVEANQRLGQYFDRLPLVTAPKIRVGNALEIPWDDVLPRAEATFVLGNPPYVGKAQRTDEQRSDVERVWADLRGHGVLDYVTCWYRVAADYLYGSSARAAFVSTNSIVQGEQVGLLWPDLFARGVRINFAHRTFSWTSEARGRANVDVVIVGFGLQDSPNKWIYDYDTAAGADGNIAIVSLAKNIGPYLTDGSDAAVRKRAKPISDVPEMSYGNMPNDGGNLLLTTEQRDKLVAGYPSAARFIRPFVGPQEFLDGLQRWCLWLVDAAPSDVRRITPILMRIEAVRTIRMESTRPTTRELANKPMLFGEIRQPASRYLGVPKTSSEQRRYIPIGFFDADVIASSDLLTIEGATHYEFGILSSAMHMTWVRTVGGRLESRYRYSATLVYNSYPWPQGVDAKQRAAVETCARAVERIRASLVPPNGTNTIADIYDHLTMPAQLADAHAALDRAVDRCYRDKAFRGDRERFEHLMLLHERALLPLKIARGRPKLPPAKAYPERRGEQKTRAVAESTSPSRPPPPSKR